MPSYKRGNPGGKTTKKALAPNTQATGTTRSAAPKPTALKAGAPSGHRGTPRGTGYTQPPKSRPLSEKTKGRKPGRGGLLP